MAFSANQMLRLVAIPRLVPMSAIGQTGANQVSGPIEAD